MLQQLDRTVNAAGIKPPSATFVNRTKNIILNTIIVEQYLYILDAQASTLFQLPSHRSLDFPEDTQKPHIISAICKDYTFKFQLSEKQQPLIHSTALGY